MFPWLPNHGSIEARSRRSARYRALCFRGYRTTAPLKPPLPLHHLPPAQPFPWLPNHGSIEAGRSCLGAYSGRWVSVVTEPRLH